MNTTTAEKIETLHACFGSYPHTKTLKSGEIKSDRVELKLTEIEPVYKAFLAMAREQKFDVSEMAIVTYLQAKAFGKPLTLMPATMMGRFQHGTLLYNSERETVTPQICPASALGVRSFAQTTGVWMRGILWKDYGLDLSRVKWVTFEDAHLAEFRDPPGVERAADGKDMTKMLLAGELDAAIFGGAMPTDPRLKSVIPDRRRRRRRAGTRRTTPCRSTTWWSSPTSCRSPTPARCAKCSACCTRARRPPACRSPARSTRSRSATTTSSRRST